MPLVRYRPEVASDLLKAADWYDGKRAGLGEEFIAEYWAAIDKITERPLSYAITATGLRACRLSRFPYVVHYRYSDEEIVIYAVMFGGRDTSAWIHRI